MEAANADSDESDSQLLSVIAPTRLDEAVSPVDGRRFSRT